MNPRFHIDLIRDVRRSLLSGRSTVLLAVLSMAIGIAATTVALSVIDVTMLRPLPYPQSSRIVELVQPSKDLGQSWPFTYRFFMEAQGHLPALDSLAALSFSDVVLETGAQPETVTLAACSASLVDVLRTSPLLGRFLTREEEIRTSGGAATVISERLWRREFGADPEVAGRKLRVDGRPFTIVGVMPNDLRLPPLPTPPEVWIPLGADPALDQLEKMFPSTWDRSAYLTIWGRLSESFRPSVEERIKAASLPLLERTDTDFSQDHDFRVVPVERQLREDYGVEISVLVTATLLTLLVSCANVSNLILSREPARRVSVSIRYALGETAGGTVARALLEGVAISLCGSVLGVAATRPLFRILHRYLPDGLLPWNQFPLSGAVLAQVLCVSITCGIVMSLIPAVRLTRLGVDAWKGGSARSSTEGRSAKRSRRLIVVSEIACSVVALALGAVLFRSYWGVATVPLGFEPGGVMVADLKLPRDQGTGDRWKKLGKSVAATIASQAGVDSVAVALAPPAGRVLRTSYQTNLTPDRTAGIADYIPVGPDYFDALRIPILKGRSLVESDTAQSQKVCVVNQTLSRDQLPAGQEIGARIIPYGLDPCEVVGVVGDVVSRKLRQPPHPAVYLPFDQLPSEIIQGYMTFLVRTDGVSAKAAGNYLPSLLKEAVHREAPSVPVSTTPLESIVGDLSSFERFRAMLIGGVSLLNLVLSAVGVYGMSVNYMTHGRREMAIRFALGGTAGRLVGGFVMDALRLTVVGSLLGFACAYPLVKVLGEVVFGVHSLTALEVTGVVLVVALVAALSAYVPGRKVVAMDPAEVLKDA